MSYSSEYDKLARKEGFAPREKDVEFTKWLDKNTSRHVHKSWKEQAAKSIISENYNEPYKGRSG